MLYSAGLDWYKKGTVNATNGSSTITGTNTDWKDAGLKTGDIFTMDDQNIYEIANVVNNTTLSLTKAFRGTTVTGQDYSIIRNFAATIPGEVLAEVTELMRTYREYIASDLTHIKGERGDPGLYYKGAWTAAVTYDVLDVVMYNNKLYVAKTTHVSAATNAPATAGSAWQDMALTVPDGVDVFNYNSAGLHNSLYRGKNLGNTLTAAQSAVIKAGTFTDLWIGDYWTATNLAYTYVDANGDTQNATYSGTLRIADFNYFLRSGDQGDGLTTNHIVVVPDVNMFSHYMNATDITTGAYVGSAMYTMTDGIARARAIIKAFFGADHVLSHREYLQNAVTDGCPSAGAWYDSDVELMSEPMVYGGFVFNSGASNGTVVRNRHTVACKQLNLFRLRPDLISNRQWYWLRDVVSAAAFAKVNYGGYANSDNASNVGGVRPAALIY